MGQQEFYSFNDVLRELQIEREELERMMQEGEVTAFREGDKIKFRKDDIEDFKASKMSQPTIAVHTEKEGDALLIEEIVEEESPKDFATAEEEAAPQPIFSLGEDDFEEPKEPPKPKAYEAKNKMLGKGKEEVKPKEAKAKEETKSKAKEEIKIKAKEETKSKNKPVSPKNEFKETKSLLGIEESASQPLLDFHHKDKDKPVKTSPDKTKPDTEELVFEQESGDDLLETGELLFESKENILPRDKEMEELFTDSEMGISPFDSREQEIQEAWDLAESSGEEIVSTASAGSASKGVLAIDESKKKKSIKSVGTIAAGVLAFGVLTFFIMFSGQQKDAVPVKVKLYQVQETSLLQEKNVRGDLQQVKSFTIVAGGVGKIQNLVASGTIVKRDSAVAYMMQQNEAAALEIKQLEQNVAVQQGNLQKIADEKKIVENLYRTNQGYQAARRLADATKKTDDQKKRDDELQKYSVARQKFADLAKQYEHELNVKDLSKQYSAMKELLAKMEIGQNQKLEAMKMAIAEKAKEAIPQKVAIVAPEDGVVKKWEVKEAETIENADKVIMVLSQIKAELQVSDNDALDWKPGEVLTLQYESKNIKGILDKRYTDRGTDPVIHHLTVLVTDCEIEFQPKGKIFLTYQKTYTGMLKIPQMAILKEQQGSFVLAVKEDNKIYKRDIRPEKSENDWVVVSSDGVLAKGNQIIHQIVFPKNKQLKDLNNGQSVSVQKD